MILKISLLSNNSIQFILMNYHHLNASELTFILIKISSLFFNEASMVSFGSDITRLQFVIYHPKQKLS